MRKLQTLIVAIGTGAMLCCAGCDMPFFGGSNRDLVKPTIAVMKFDNHAASVLNWNLGDGMADVLVDRLVATGRYQVLERAEMKSISEEMKLQESGVTRPHNRATTGRIKNVQYLIKGAVTDFAHVLSNSGFAGANSGWWIFGGGNRAVMGILLYVVDVESGQIICSERITDSVRANDLNMQSTYKGVGFGGDAFYQTPLGQATEKVIDKAVRKITQTIAAQPWEAKIALVQPDGTVIINGGQDRGIAVGACYEVLVTGEPVLDPDTGDVIGHRGGKTVARVQVTGVEPLCCQANVIAGKIESVQVGQRCRRIKT